MQTSGDLCFVGRSVRGSARKLISSSEEIETESERQDREGFEVFKFGLDFETLGLERCHESRVACEKAIGCERDGGFALPQHANIEIQAHLAEYIEVVSETEVGGNIFKEGRASQYSHFVPVKIANADGEIR